MLGAEVGLQQNINRYRQINKDPIIAPGTSVRHYWELLSIQLIGSARGRDRINPGRNLR